MFKSHSNCIQIVFKSYSDHSKFLSQAGGGKKQITSIGEDIVNALPDQEAVKNIVQNHKSGKRKKHKRTKIAAKKNK